MARIFGKNIMLREYQREDLRYIRNWVNDPQITDTLSDIFLFPHSMDMTEGFIEMMMEGKNPNTKGFIIAHRQSGKYIGQIDLFKIDWKNRCAELAITIGNAEQQGKGIGKEAICLLLDFAFHRMNLHRIGLEVYDFNERGYRCYKSAGFKEEGRQRQCHYHKGQYRDKIYMGILQDEYKEGSFADGQ